METPARERPRAVTLIGWTWLILAALRLVNGVLGLTVWKLGGLDEGVPFVPLRETAVQVRMLGLETMMRHASEILLAQVLVAAVAAWASFELLRLHPRGRSVLLAISWIGIAFMATLGACVYVWTARLGPNAGVAAGEARLAGAATGAFIALLGAAFFGGTIFLLRRPSVRSAFPLAA